MSEKPVTDPISTEVTNRMWWFDYVITEELIRTSDPLDLEGGQIQTRVRELLREKTLDRLIWSGLLPE